MYSNFVSNLASTVHSAQWSLGYLSRSTQGDPRYDRSSTICVHGRGARCVGSGHGLGVSLRLEKCSPRINFFHRLLELLTLYIPFCILKHISAQIRSRYFITAHSRAHTTQDLSLERAHQEIVCSLFGLKTCVRKLWIRQRSVCRASRQLRRTHRQRDISRSAHLPCAPSV